MWHFHPYPTIYPYSGGISFGMWDRLLDVINCAKFQLDQFRGFGASGGQKLLYPIDWRGIALTTMLHCDIIIIIIIFFLLTLVLHSQGVRH